MFNRLWNWPVRRILEPDVHHLHSTMQDMHQHYKHMSQLHNRHPVQPLVHILMPRQDVQRHQHLPIMSLHLLILHVINLLHKLHITLLAIQQLLHQPMPRHSCCHLKQLLYKVHIDQLPQMPGQWHLLQLCLWLLVVEWRMSQRMSLVILNQRHALHRSPGLQSRLSVQQHVPCSVVNRHGCCAHRLYDVQTAKSPDLPLGCCLLASRHHINFSNTVLYLLVLRQWLLCELPHRHVCGVGGVGSAILVESAINRAVYRAMLWQKILSMERYFLAQ